MKRNLLRFSTGNAKLHKLITTFSLPAGWSCPGAHACKARADKETGRITDGDAAEFRCHMAMAETRPNVRAMRWHNWELLRAAGTRRRMRDLILASLPWYCRLLRLHASGDFFSRAYFDAWLAVAWSLPEVTFYAYTKSLPYWVYRRREMPANLVLTASYGGLYDGLIAEHGLRYAKVVEYEEDAAALGLEIDHDDSHAARPGPSFALLLHGQQRAGSRAAEVMADRKARGLWSGYGGRPQFSRISLL